MSCSYISDINACVLGRRWRYTRVVSFENIRNKSLTWRIMLSERRTKDQTWQDTNKFKSMASLSCLFSLFPEQSFSQVFALGITWKELLVRPIILVSNFSVSPDHCCETAWSKDQSFDFVLQTSLYHIFCSFHCGPNQLILILWYSSWNRRCHMKDSMDPIQGLSPGSSVKKIGLS